MGEGTDAVRHTYFVAPKGPLAFHGVWVHNASSVICDTLFSDAFTLFKGQGETTFRKTYPNLPEWLVSVFSSEATSVALNSAQKDAVRAASRKIWEERAGQALSVLNPNHEVRHSIPLESCHST